MRVVLEMRGKQFWRTVWIVRLCLLHKECHSNTKTISLPISADELCGDLVSFKGVQINDREVDSVERVQILDLPDGQVKKR